MILKFRVMETAKLFLKKIINIECIIQKMVCDRHLKEACCFFCTHHETPALLSVINKSSACMYAHTLNMLWTFKSQDLAMQIFSQAVETHLPTVH